MRDNIIKNKSFFLLFFLPLFAFIFYGCGGGGGTSINMIPPATSSGLTLADVEASIIQEGAEWVAGETEVSGRMVGLTDEQIALQLAGALVEEHDEGDALAKPLYAGRAAQAYTVPSSFDWRNYQSKNWMTSIKNQGSCGACTAFGALGALEPIYRFKKSNHQLSVDFSEADLFFCSGGKCNSGGYLSSIANRIKRDGTVNEMVLIYHANDNSTSLCNVERPTGVDVYKITDWAWVNSNANVIKYVITKYGPSPAVMKLSPDFMYYKSGVYKPVRTSFGWHTVTIVGWADTGGTTRIAGATVPDGYWIIKNSWGEDWGMDGYAYVSYGSVDLEQHTMVLIAPDEIQPNQAPTVSITANPTSGDAPLAVNFTSSCSDSDGYCAAYSWNFGDGGIAGSANPSYTFSTAGAYNVILTVTDDDGATTTASATITVNAPPVNNNPTANAGADQAITLPTSTITLTGSGSDSDGDTVSCAWTQSSGPTTATLSGQNTCTLTASALAEGSYVFQLATSDGRGGAATDTVTVTVNPEPNTPPTATAAASAGLGMVPLAINFTGTCTDSDGTCASYSWDFGDGATSTDQNPVHTFTTPASYVITLTVTDDDGATATDTVTVIANSPPVVGASADLADALTLETVNFTGTCTDTGGSCTSYLWDFGDGNTSTLISPSYSYTATGTYTVTFTAMDDQGAMTSATFTFNVYLSNEWITIPAGNFLMGCATLDGSCQANENPLHTVTVPMYEIQKYEVTVAQYLRCVDAGLCTLPANEPTGQPIDYLSNVAYYNYPIAPLTWQQAVDYCTWVGGRLPSEAEWEKAARGSSPSENIYPWGDTAPDCSVADAVGCAAISPNLYQVGSFPLGTSTYGLLDMAVNAWEWVEDDWHNNYSGAPIDGSAWNEFPRLTIAATRSGENADPALYRNSFRQAQLKTSTNNTISVRCAR